MQTTTTVFTRVQVAPMHKTYPTFALVFWYISGHIENKEISCPWFFLSHPPLLVLILGHKGARTRVDTVWISEHVWLFRLVFIAAPLDPILDPLCPGNTTHRYLGEGCPGFPDPRCPTSRRPAKTGPWAAPGQMVQAPGWAGPAGAPECDDEALWKKMNLPMKTENVQRFTSFVEAHFT